MFDDLKRALYARGFYDAADTLHHRFHDYSPQQVSEKISALRRRD